MINFTLFVLLLSFQNPIFPFFYLYLYIYYYYYIYNIDINGKEERAPQQRRPILSPWLLPPQLPGAD